MAQILDAEAGIWQTLPPEGSTIAVHMPCGNEALAEVISHLRSAHGSGWINGLRIRWLPATGTFIRGYKVCWGKKVETIEGTLPFPPNSNEEMYGTVQMGEYRLADR